ncbi:hypothetical protein [Virgibacillus halodenitrificans]|uniref:Uncharacterized protein n=1 Tax=Virgibacillus halodenitrificans TaxID=1482 RepID=A0ABR7VJ84_VIRHA|nr:hypothetical protein [Virgibacillus halodenitrificans]MBD1221985.1 hypothetical protein [Virgibacillus halodenitrificans]MYL59911.1 hypothetical protein [Virgibacillus halodenitrificans]
MRFERLDWALFTGVFVGIAILIMESLIKNPPFLITIFVAGGAAFIGGLLGNKLFPQK